jgi:hypothetical protein
MKKIILMGAVLFASYAQAQIIEVTGNDGEIITPGYEYVTNTLLADQGADLPLHVKNLTNNDIYVKLRMDLVENAASMDFPSTPGVQFCFGQLCYFEVQAEDIVPTDIANALIPANGQNEDGNHFLNNYPGDNTGLPVKYTMTLVQYDAANNFVADLLTFKYIYDTTANVTDFTSLQNIGINVKNTAVTNTLEMDATLAANLEVFDINGKLIKDIAISNGINTADLSSLNAGVYIARFTTEENKTAQIRIVKN